MNFNDTIAAIATGNAVSAIGIVRISGPEAIPAAQSIFRSAAGIQLRDAKDRQMYYGQLTDINGGLIDLCLCTVSRMPGSYTGEDTVEFHCHGSPVVLAETLRALFAKGVRQAAPGEFTKRAFLNGRIDLTQAEAVIDLIEAETPLGAKNAAGQLHGAVCTKMNAIYDKLTDIVSHFHAVIDYPDEDIDEFEINNYIEVLRGCSDELCRLLSTHERGKVLCSGIPAVIAGRTNTGKSSLLNALLGYDRAIVTDIAGTTRDTINEKITLGNVLLRLTDTAGLRTTDDTVEKLGAERTKQALSGAGLVLLVLDGSQPLRGDDFEVLENIPPDIPLVIIINKADLPLAINEKDVLSHFAPVTAQALQNNIIYTSALKSEGLDKLTARIQEIFPLGNTVPAGDLITSVRQAEAIGRAQWGMECALTSLSAGASPDAVVMDIEAALASIGEVTGKTMREDIVSRIFERFCVGK